MVEESINHEEAWLLAHYKQENSNLARCYIELRKRAEDVVKTYDQKLERFEINWPMKLLREITEANS